jgi:uncharacterized protein (TIGR02284 family)
MTEPGKAENSNVITVLNDLVVTCKDGEKGFRAASLGVADSELATLFLNYSEQRAGFAAELLAEIRRIGGESETGSGDQGTPERGWAGIVAVVESKDEAGIISEAERSEDHAVQEYGEALKKNLPTGVQTIVENHYIHVRDAHEHIQALERVYHERAAAPPPERA